MTASYGVHDDVIPVVFRIVVVSTLTCVFCCALCCVYCICQPIFRFFLGTCCGRGSGKHRHDVFTLTGADTAYGSVSQPRDDFAPSAPIEQFGNDAVIFQGYQYPSAPALLPIEYHEIICDHEVPLVDAYIIPPLQVHEASDSPIDGGVQAKFRDVWAAAFFLLNFSAVCTAAVVACKRHLSGDFNMQAVLQTYGLGNVLVGDVMAAMSIIAAMPFILGTIWLSLVINHSKFMIKSMLWFGVVVTASLAIIFLFLGQIVLSICMIILCGLSVWYISAIQNRLDFAAAVLNVASHSIKLHYRGLIAAVSVLCMLQMLWVVVWGAAGADIFSSLLGSGTQTASGDARLVHNNKFLCFLLLVSLYWGVMLGTAIVECIVSGLVSCWWFQPQRPQALKGSVFRAMIYSFGSLCLGSLIVSVVMATRALFRMLRGGGTNRRSGPNLVVQCFYYAIDYFLGAIEYAIQYFNKYAICYVAAYGENFVTSGRNVMSLFERRGFTAIINDNLMANVFQLTVVILTIFSGLFGYFVAYVWTCDGEENSTFLMSLTFFGLLSGCVVGLALSSMLNSATSAVFVAFAEDPHVLKVNHFDHFHNLYASWEKMYPHSVDWIQHSAYADI